MKNTNGSQKREWWNSKTGFILACVGSAVGMGNIWLFPYRMATYGGSFLLVYLIFDVLLGFSGVVGEMSFGRAVRSGPVEAFGTACASRGESKRNIGRAIGAIPMLGALALAIGYSVVVSWIVKYMTGSITGSVLKSDSVDGFAASFGQMASSFGNNLWLIIVLVITFVIMAAGISSGIEKANKVMIPVFYVLFIGLAVYVALQPGAADGYRWMFTIRPEAFKDPMLYVFALGQSFFSLSLAGNGTIIYGSYLSDKEDTVSSAITVAICDTCAAMLAALFAGLTSLVNLYEAPVATLQDNLKFGRAKAVIVIAAVGAAVSLCIQGIVSQWMDFVSIYICPLGAGLAGIMFAWVWGRKAVEDAVSTGRKHPVGKWYYPLYKYVFCILTIAVFVLGALNGGIG